MASQPHSAHPSRPASPAARGVDPSIATRVAELRAEAEAAQERAHKAALLYEAAFLTETALRQPAQAVNDYLTAYNLENRFRHPLHALIRLFERKRSLKNLARLYDSEQRSAHTPEEKATALLDQAVLAMASDADAETIRPRLERALEYDDGAQAALLLEFLRRVQGDHEGALKAVARRARTSDDPVHAGFLALEVAEDLERRGQLGDALSALKGAAAGGDECEPFLNALSRFARTHGFVNELVEAYEKQAELAAKTLREVEEGAVLEADPHVSQEQLKARAVALWYESARLRCTSLSDPDGALACIDRALALRPDDLLLRQTRMLAFDLMEDRTRAADEARALLAQGLDGEHAAALHFRLAEHALVTGDLKAARESLMEAIAHAGGSVAADAILDDLLLDEGLHRERIERREARATTGNAARAARFLFEAAQIAASNGGDAERARELFQRAAKKADAPAELAREAYGAGLDLDDPELMRLGLDGLLGQTLEPDERAALLHHRIELATSEAEARALLEANLDAETGRFFFPRLSRVRAAEGQAFGLLALAHERLADASIEPDAVTAHLCAAARAHAREGELERARTLLDRVLTRDPTHRFALALQQEVLRRLGRASDIVALLRRAAEAKSGEAEAEVSLLRAGVAAELAGDVPRAVQSYEEAATRHPEAVSPAWALLRLGQRHGDAELTSNARHKLAALEREHKRPGLECLLLAEDTELVRGDPEQARKQLDGALSDPLVGHHVAMVLASTAGTSAEDREQAIEALAQRVADEARPPLLRELGGMLLAQGAEHARVVDVVERLEALAPGDLWALWTRVSIPVPHDEEGHAEALLKLAAATSDAQLAQSAREEAVFARALARPGEGLTPMLDALPKEAALSSEFAELVLELASPSADAPLRARALAHPDVLGNEPPASRALAQARAYLAAGQAVEAVATLEGVLQADPTSVEALELLRVAARKAENFAHVASAAEALAAHVDGELSLQLLEESAVVRMDELSDLRGAERVLRTILARDPGRKLAYERLHDLLSAREDTESLLELVRKRSELVDDAEELTNLFYELARLHRANGDLDAALEALDKVLMLDDHVGALALAAEIHTARESWAEAVEALTALAEAPFVPDAQRRLARIGAADFLEHRLHDGPGALRQLERAAETGPADAALFTRIADVAERTGDKQRAVSALRSAIELAQGERRNALRLRCATLLAESLGDQGGACALARSVLEEQPGHLQAARALHGWLNEAGERSRVLDAFERAVRSELQSAPLEALPAQKLLALGDLRGDDGARFVALASLCALRHATLSEQQRLEELRRKRAQPRAQLSDADLAGLSQVAPAYAALLDAVFAHATEIDQLEPGRFGVGRGQRLSTREAHPLREALAQLSAPLGLGLSDVYVGGDDPERVVAIPQDAGVTWVLGGHVSAPLTGVRRAQVALQLAAVRTHRLPLLTRTPAQAARLVLAAMAAADCPLPGEVLREELGELPRSLHRALPRKVRKALPDLVRALPDGGQSLEQACVEGARAARRLALLIADDLTAPLELMLGAMPNRDSIAASADALDLVVSWSSSAMDSLRSKLGFTR